MRRPFEDLYPFAFYLGIVPGLFSADTDRSVCATSESGKSGRYGRLAQELEQAGDVFAHFGFPVGPVVAALGAPIVEGVADAFAGEDLGEAVGGGGVFPFAGAGDQMNVAGGQVTVGPRVAQILEVVDRVVEVEIIVVEAVHEVFEIVDAGHGEAAFDYVGVLEEGVRGVVGAEGHAHGGDANAWGFAVVPDEGDDFFAEVGVENGLDVAAGAGGGGAIVEAGAVDGIYAEK